MCLCEHIQLRILGLQKIDEDEGAHWLQKHLLSSYEPLLKTPWILDTDVTDKPLYGYQEGVVNC